MIKRQVAIEAEPRAEPRKDALVAAAYKILATRGFEGLRTREVAAAVGVNIATLHYYFPHKEDLIRGVVGYAMGRFRGHGADVSVPVTCTCCGFGVRFAG